MKSWFLRRNCPHEVVDKKMNKGKFSFNSVRETFRNEQVNCVFFIVTYQFFLNRTNNIIDKLYIIWVTI